MSQPALLPSKSLPVLLFSRNVISLDVINMLQIHQRSVCCANHCRRIPTSCTSTSTCTFPRHKSLGEIMCFVFLLMRSSYKSMPKPSLTATFFLFLPVSENGDHLSRWVRHAHCRGRSSSTPELLKGIQLNPTTQRVIINWTQEFARYPEPWSMG